VPTTRIPVGAKPSRNSETTVLLPNTPRTRAARGPAQTTSCGARAGTTASPPAPRRARDTEDRRRVFIELTEDLHARAGEIWGPLAGVSGEFLARHSDAELRVLRDFLRDSIEVLDEHAARVRALPPRD
jgi:hypothetical protein